ncbi:Uncharacterised protein [Proteus mirabilis]|uniref:Uncharacterized protein n=1 Tax=Proteus mirabilis TaxID=584 RepID=A0A379GDZ4_PROMI|nr:Uncharacterised protein [Proteus mirabilis]
MKELKKPNILNIDNIAVLGYFRSNPLIWNLATAKNVFMNE